MLIFLDRSRSGDDPHLDWRVRLMAIGAALGLGGMLLGISWLIPIALVPLVAGVGLRYVRPGQRQQEGEGDPPA